MTVQTTGPTAPAEFSWVCNECDSHEFTDAVQESDLDYLACSGCGCPEFHKEPKAREDAGVAA